MSTGPSKNELLKRESAHLRGHIALDLADDNAFVSDDSYELLKFFGSYQGYDRDTATTRKKAGLDKEWEFMLRLKVPAGRITAAQYLALDALCGQRANGSLRVTSRQTFQFHQIVKGNLAPFIAEINQLMLSTLGGCGDVNRNVITCPAPIKDTIHFTLEQAVYAIARHLTPHAAQESYADVFLNGEKLPNPASGTLTPFNAADSAEPIYGDSYMPRKFKIAIGQPEDNCMDALANDLALLALFNGQELVGYNVALGGGFGCKHNNAKTYPRLASPVAFVKPDDLLRIAEATVKLQRDHGDRADRQHARLKYVVQENGPQWTFDTLQRYFGKPLDMPKPLPKFHVEDHMGWHEQGDGKLFLGLPVPAGRIKDHPTGEHIRSALREIVSTYQTPMVLTPDVNLILADIPPAEKPAISAILKKHGVKQTEEMTHLARHFTPCVALPTCGKALAESERVTHPLTHVLDELFAKHGLSDEKIAIRIAGCPNGCSRPYVGDIGIVGSMPGHYVLFIGGDFEGTRLNSKVFDRVPLEHIPTALEPMLVTFKAQRQPAEAFGNFCHRVGISTVKQAALASLAGQYKWAA